MMDITRLISSVGGKMARELFNGNISFTRWLRKTALVTLACSVLWVFLFTLVFGVVVYVYWHIFDYLLGWLLRHLGLVAEEGEDILTWVVALTGKGYTLLDRIFRMDWVISTVAVVVFFELLLDLVPVVFGWVWRFMFPLLSRIVEGVCGGDEQ